MISSIPPFLLIGLGAMAGSWMRMYLIEYWFSIFSSKYWGTFIVNISASFLLGLFFGIHSHFGELFEVNVSSLFYLVCVGFLGSLSTFSTFIGDLLNNFLLQEWKKLFYLSVFSIFGGLFAVALGIFLGHA